MDTADSLPGRNFTCRSCTLLLHANIGRLIVRTTYESGLATITVVLPYGTASISQTVLKSLSLSVHIERRRYSQDCEGTAEIFKANKRGWSKFLNNLKNIFFDILDYLNDAICDHTLNEFEQFYKSKKPYTGSK